MPDAPLPATPQGAAPFVSVTVLPTGLHIQTNLTDRVLVLGLLQTAQFQIMLTNPDPPTLHPPLDGMRGVLKRLRR